MQVDYFSINYSTKKSSAAMFLLLSIFFFWLAESRTSYAQIIFEDDFNRSNSTTVGNSWTETDDDASAEAQILNNRLDFDAINDVYQPMVEHTFAKQSSGRIKWTYVFNFENTAYEYTYEVRMQLGDNALMVDPSTSPNTGVAVNLIWGGLNNGLTNTEGFGYVQSGSVTEVSVVSGDAGDNAGGDATIEIIADLDANTFDLTITGSGLISGAGGVYSVAFDNNVDIDKVRIFLNGVDENNFGDLEIDSIKIETLTGSAPASSRKAIDFDGDDDYVVTQSNFSPPSDGTLTFWMKVPGTPSGASRLLGLGDGWEIRHETTGQLHFDLNITGTNDTFITNSAVDATGVWYHIAAVFSSTNDTYEVYVNGILDKSGSLTLTAQSANLLSIGTTTGSGQNWEGTLDEIRIWDTELTASEIRTNMCQKLTGSESGLVGYWLFDEASGTTCIDSSSNGNNGTMTNMAPAVDRVWTGAPVGDESSFDYTGTNPGDFTANIAHANGDDITATGDGGTLTGIHVYRVDENSLRPGATEPSGWTLGSSRYWGVFVVGASPTYTVTYNYDGHPAITDEDDLGLAFRDNHSDNSWADVGATLDTDANTLVQTAQTGAEYALGSKTGDNPLPVELSVFRADVSDGNVHLYWRTESEFANVGFKILRSTEEQGAYELMSSYEFNAALTGQTNSSASQEYGYVDDTVVEGVNYWYKLVDVAVNGVHTVHGPITATPKAGTIPGQFELYQNYPNPFNPFTEIKFFLPTPAKVQLKIYNISGQKVVDLLDQPKQNGYHTVKWDGRNNYGNAVPSGTYFYIIQTQDLDQAQSVKNEKLNKVRKMILLK